MENWQRYMLAGFSVAFLTVGAVLAATDFLGSGSNEFISGTLLKVGFVLGIAWMAAPQLERLGWNNLRGSLLVAVIIVIVLWAIRPRIGAIAGAILLVGSLLFSIGGWIRGLAQPDVESQKRSNRR